MNTTIWMGQSSKYPIINANMTSKNESDLLSTDSSTLKIRSIFHWVHYNKWKQAKLSMLSYASCIFHHETYFLGCRESLICWWDQWNELPRKTDWRFSGHMTETMWVQWFLGDKMFFSDSKSEYLSVVNPNMTFIFG